MAFRLPAEGDLIEITDGQRVYVFDVDTAGDQNDQRAVITCHDDDGNEVEIRMHWDDEDDD